VKWRLAARTSGLAARAQVKYNLLERAPERGGLLQRCADLDVTLVAHSPLSQGLLTGAAASAVRRQHSSPRSWNRCSHYNAGFHAASICGLL